MGLILIYVSSVIITGWGIAHLVPTRKVINGFGQLSIDNKRIITMEWIAEGLTLCFIGLLALSVAVSGQYRDQVAVIVYWALSAMLLIMATLTSLTGARTSVVFFKICPVVKGFCALLLILGTLL